MRTRRLLLVAVAALTVLVGCAQPGTGVAGPGDATSTPSSSVGPLPSGPVSMPPSKGVPSQGQTVTVTGTVQNGVEAKCLILRTDTASYLLLDGDPAVVVEGARLKVTGVVRTDLRSYCMQGIPLQVQQAVAA